MALWGLQSAGYVVSMQALAESEVARPTDLKVQQDADTERAAKLDKLQTH